MTGLFLQVFQVLSADILGFLARFKFCGLRLIAGYGMTPLLIQVHRFRASPNESRENTGFCVRHSPKFNTFQGLGLGGVSIQDLAFPERWRQTARHETANDIVPNW